MTPQTLPPKPTATGNRLDTLLQELCQTHGLSAVGKTLAQLYGRMQAMQAVLGYLEAAEPDAISAISNPPLVTHTPAHSTGVAGLITSRPNHKEVAASAGKTACF